MSEFDFGHGGVILFFVISIFNFNVLVVCFDVGDKNKVQDERTSADLPTESIPRYTAEQQVANLKVHLAEN